MRRRPVRTQAGFSSLEYALGVGLLLMPIAVVAATLPVWPERQAAARQAANEAARTVALGDEWGAATAEGGRVADEVAANYGLDPADVSVAFAGSLERGGSVTARATVRMPVLRFPRVATVGEWSWSTAHTEAVDAYRSFP